MNAQYLPFFTVLFILTISSARNLHSEENFGNLDLLDNNDLITANHENFFTTCPNFSKPIDCAEVYKNGYKNSALYTIYPNHRVIPCGKITVHCDMTTDGGGWTVIQRRGEFKRDIDYFYKTWAEYKTGFGNLKEDFWLGNDYIHILSNQKKYSVRFDLETVKNEKAYAHYDEFWVENEELKYRLHIDHYSGNAGDSMSLHNNMSFSTKDRSNDNSSTTPCAVTYKGGWWYNKCHTANLNGIHYKGQYEGKTANGTVWKTWKGFGESLKKVEIKIRPTDFRYKTIN